MAPGIVLSYFYRTCGSERGQAVANGPFPMACISTRIPATPMLVNQMPRQHSRSLSVPQVRLGQGMDSYCDRSPHPRWVYACTQAISRQHQRQRSRRGSLYRIPRTIFILNMKGSRDKEPRLWRVQRLNTGGE